MFALAIFIGIYSYCIFFLGLLGFLYRESIVGFTIGFISILCFLRRKGIRNEIQRISKLRKTPSKLFLFLIVLFVAQAFVNFIGALGPELAFDALWYHLTLPKLYLLHHAIFHIPGGLLYYSDMPKLGEMLYVGALSFGNEIYAKLIHFTFGILVSIVLYKFARKFFTPILSMLTVVIFYSNLVVDWESITAYVDLMRTFFELIALWSFIVWLEDQKLKRLVLSAVMIGLAVATKVLSIGSILIFSMLLLVTFFLPRLFSNKASSIQFLLRNLFIYWFTALFVPLPWFLFSYANTGTPFYPFFTSLYHIVPSPLSLFGFFHDVWNLFIHSADPISPIYLLFFSLLFVTFAKFKREIKVIVWYCALSLIVWYFTPQTGGGRFIMAYLPAFSLVSAAIISAFEKNWIKKYLIFLIILVSCISIGYRFVVNIKYLPVLVGYESKQQFLTNHLNFSYGDFYDIDNYFKKTMSSQKIVLLYGFHNLYYINFPFIDSSWVTKGDRFNYVAIQNTSLPIRFKNWQLIYKNDKTMVQLYKPPMGECSTQCQY